MAQIKHSQARPGLRQLMRASALRTGRALWQITPVLLGVLLLAGLVVQLVPRLLHSGLFGRSACGNALSSC
ncbi:MAG TPA: hypothetical protein ENK53_06810 [Thiotrichales bacterium]|nr:hypothetical protein [Thiotrichales bacterium]